MQKITLLAVVLCAGLATQANAQFVVSDPPAEAADAEIAVTNAEIAVTNAEIAGTNSEIAGTTAGILKAVTAPRPTESVSALDELSNSMPSSATIENQLFETETPSNPGATAVVARDGKNLVGLDDAGELARENLSDSANIAGVAQDNLASLQARIALLPAQEAKLDSATDLMSAVVAAAHIEAQHSIVSAQNAQASNLSALAIARQQVSTIEEQGLERGEHQQTAVLLSAP